MAAPATRASSHLEIVMIRPFRYSQNALIGGRSKPSDGRIGSSWNTGLSSQFFSFQRLMALLIRSMSGLRGLFVWKQKATTVAPDSTFEALAFAVPSIHG